MTRERETKSSFVKKEMCQVIVKIRILTDLKLGDTQKVKNRRQKKRGFLKKGEIMAVSEQELIMSMINVMKIIENGIIRFCHCQKLSLIHI